MITTAPSVSASGATLLIDECLPRYDFAIAHARILPAPPDACYEAALRIDLRRAPIVRALLALRGLPHRFARGPQAPSDVPLRTFGLRDMIGPPLNWALLGEMPGQELTLGQISRPWQSAELPRTPPATPAAFAAFNEPGYAKIVFALRVTPHGRDASVVTAETRMAMTDPASRQRFAHYWLLVGPFSELIRRLALRQLERELRPALPPASAHAPQPLPFGERLRMQIEHQIDTRSIRLAAWLYRRTEGRIARLWHRRVLLLTTTGRKTGQRRTVPLQYFPDNDAMIVVAANSGLPAPPGWYFNVSDDPRAVFEVDGRIVDVRAEEMAHEQAAVFWPQVLAIALDYDWYRQRTGRPIPLVRLVPASTAVAGA